MNGENRPFERLAIALVLAAAALVPLHADPETVRVFEGNKVLLLRTLGTLALASALLARPTRDLRALGLRGIGGLGVAVYLGASTIAAFSSVAPALALPGNWERQQGFATDLALAGVFLAARLAARRATLLTDVLLAGGAISGVLACAQALDFSAPFPLLVDETSRAGGLAGGPTFLGSHLAPLVPLALATCNSIPRLLVAFAIAAGTFASGSRVAAAAAVLGALVAAALSMRERRGRSFAGIAAVAALAALTAIPALRESLPEDALPNRVTAEAARRDVGERLELWSGAASAIGADPARFAFGHGPDSIAQEFAPSVTPALQRRLGGATRVDRFHCDWLDLLFTRGALAVAGIVLLLIGAARAGLAARRVAGASADAASLAGWMGALVALAADATFSVSGATSRMLLFLVAGLLVGRAALSATAPAPEPASGEPRARSLLAGLCVVAVAFATRDLAWLALALPCALIVRPARGSSAPLVPGLLVAGSFLVATFVIDVSIGGRSAVHSPGIAAAHGILARTALLLIVAAAVAAMAFSARAEREAVDAKAPRSRVRLAVSILLLLGWAWTAKDDQLRGVADVESAAAATAEHAGGRARDAVGLLASATRHAPEVPEYRAQRAIAAIDLAAGSDAPPDPALVVESVAGDVDASVQRNQRDGWVLARGANAFLRLIPFAEKFRPGLEARALDLSRRAVARAPTACPVLETAAEAHLRVGKNEEAAALLQRSFEIDARRGRTLMLLGRAAVALEHREDAAKWHALAAATDVDPAESFAALALAAMSEGDLARASTMLQRLAARVAANPRFDVTGARKLLLFVPFHHRRDAFEMARHEWRGDQTALDAIDRALDY